MKRIVNAMLIGFFVALAPGSAMAQALQKTPASAEDSSAAAQRGVELAERGHCREALPLLKKGAPHAAGKELRRKTGLATVRCAMTAGQTEAVLDALRLLNREFPHDPDVLYVTTHAYSDLSTRSSLDLFKTAPQSYQAHELNAEALEMQGKWDDAAVEYRKIVELNSQLPGIHFRLGRLILSKPETPTTAEDARREMEAELKIDSGNAGAEYVLGELARQAQKWDEAIDHFSRTVKLDPGFADAFLGLGMALNSASRFSDAIAPLETASRLQPGNPTGHFQLTISYTRAGRKQDAEREMALYQQTSERALKEERGEGPGTPPPPQ
jgi:tetratricopeptide (TPR) repeat protein